MKYLSDLRFIKSSSVNRPSILYKRYLLGWLDEGISTFLFS